MDDRVAKTSGFGIGELGSIPESTPYDDMIAAEMATESQQALPPAYEIVFHDPHEARGFDTLSELLTYAQSEECQGRNASLFGPGYTIGSLSWTDHDIGVLNWRKPIRLETPRVVCEECGSTDVKNRRCLVCGETDMIATYWETWEHNRVVL